MARNPLQQRLIAAGAQPERADAFVQNVMKQQGTPMPEVGGKIKGPSEWYNEDYATSSEVLLPSAFRAPKYGDPNFEPYFNFVFGKDATKSVMAANLKQAPNYSSAKTSTDNFDKGIIALVEAGLSWPAINAGIAKKVSAGQLAYPSGMKSTEALSYAKDIWTEYNKYGKMSPDQLADAYKKAIARDKDFEYGMPDKRLKYGSQTNFSAGTVDILTNPKAKEKYDAFVAKNPNTKDHMRYKAFLADQATKLGYSPWKDEAARRDSLKGQRVVVGG